MRLLYYYYKLDEIQCLTFILRIAATSNVYFLVN